MYMYTLGYGTNREMNSLLVIVKYREISKVLSPEFLPLYYRHKIGDLSMSIKRRQAVTARQSLCFFFFFISLSGSIVKLSIVKLRTDIGTQTDKDIENPAVVEIAAATTIRLRQNGDQPTVKCDGKKKTNIRDGFSF